MREAIVEALCDDLATPSALNLQRWLPRHRLIHRRKLIKVALAFFGFDRQRALQSTRSVQVDDRRRLAFIREKNWAEADRIRDALLAEGIQLKDGKDPATGERVTTWEVRR